MSVRPLADGTPGQKISVVIPVFRSAATIPELVDRLTAVLGSSERPYELILVDDASPDESWVVLKRLAASDPHLRIARSLVNRGQNHATLAGLSLSRGDVVITMDDDLQHPPEEIPRLVQALNAGNDLVFGAYREKQHARWRNLGSAIVDGTQRRVFHLPRDVRLSSFRAIRRRTVDLALEAGGSAPHLTAQLLAYAPRCQSVTVRHDARADGSSGYTLFKCLRLGLQIVLGYSFYPLYVVAALCAIGFLVSLGLGAYSLGTALLPGPGVAGWAGIVAAVAFFGSVTLLSLLILGVYLWRIGEHVRGFRPRIRIDEVYEPTPAGELESEPASKTVPANRR